MKPAIDPKLDLVLERHADVAPAKVWKAWTTPDSLVKWFAPRPWTITECEVDLRPGGHIRFVMR
ncbi:MAG: SRPBCC domain-containing protein, partial [Chloroflexota bacterium]|nr:SRPBCC domain-containing protein [Chloroflexota bacterium]